MRRILAGLMGAAAIAAAVSVAPPAQANTADEDYLIELSMDPRIGQHVTERQAIELGHWVCENRARGVYSATIVKALARDTGLSRESSAPLLVYVAAKHYCPETWS